MQIIQRLSHRGADLPSAGDGKCKRRLTSRPRRLRCCSAQVWIRPGRRRPDKTSRSSTGRSPAPGRWSGNPALCRRAPWWAAHSVLRLRLESRRARKRATLSSGRRAAAAVAAGAQGSQKGMLYDVDAGAAGAIQVVSDQREIRSGDCVAVEKSGETANLRRVSASYCEKANEAAVKSVAGESRKDAEECAAAKQQLVDSATPQEADLAGRKMALLCNDGRAICWRRCESSAEAFSVIALHGSAFVVRTRGKDQPTAIEPGLLRELAYRHVAICGMLGVVAICGGCKASIQPYRLEMMPPPAIYTTGVHLRRPMSDIGSSAMESCRCPMRRRENPRGRRLRRAFLPECPRVGAASRHCSRQAQQSMTRLATGVAARGRRSRTPRRWLLEVTGRRGAWRAGGDARAFRGGGLRSFC